MTQAMTGESLAAIRQHDYFQDMAQAEFMRLARAMRRRICEQKTVIIRQGEPSQDIYFLTAGFVKVARGGVMSRRPAAAEKRHKPRKEIALAVLGPGQMFGEIAALVDVARSATVTALTDCELVQLSHVAFSECMERNHSFALAIARHLAQRLVDANHQIELLRSDTHARIMALKRHFRAIGLPPEIQPSNAEIARMVGVSREMVSKVLSERRETGP